MLLPLAEAEVQLMLSLVCLVSLAITSVHPAIEMIRMEQKVQRVVDQVELQPSQPLQERDDDWLMLFDPAKPPSGIQHPHTSISEHSRPWELVHLKPLLGFCIYLLNLRLTRDLLLQLLQRLL